MSHVTWEHVSCVTGKYVSHVHTVLWEHAAVGLTHQRVLLLLDSNISIRVRSSVTNYQHQAEDLM